MSIKNYGICDICSNNSLVGYCKLCGYEICDECWPDHESENYNNMINDDDYDRGD